MRFVSFDGNVQEEMKTVYSSKAAEMVLRICPCMVHPTWFGKREIFEACCGYRDFDACEDYDFVLRALKKWYRIGNANEYLFIHRNNPNSISNERWAKQKGISYVLSRMYRGLDRHDYSRSAEFTESEYFSKLESIIRKNEPKGVLGGLKYAWIS